MGIHLLMLKPTLLILLLTMVNANVSACDHQVATTDTPRVIRLTNLQSGKMVRIKPGEYITFKYAKIRYEGRLDSVSETAFFIGGKAFELARLEKIKAEGKKAYMKHTGKVLFTVSMLIAGAGLIGYTVYNASSLSKPPVPEDNWGGFFILMLGVLAGIAFTFTFLPGIALYFIGNEFQYYSSKMWKAESVLE